MHNLGQPKTEKQCSLYNPTVREVMEDSNIINPPEVTHVIKEFNDVIPKDSSDKLPLMHDSQYAIESDSEEFN